MSVQIIINGENAKESLLELSTLAAGFGQSIQVKTEVNAFETKPAATKVDKPIKQEAPKKEEAPKQDTPTQEESNQDPGITIEQLRALAQEKGKTAGAAAVRDVLGKYGGLPKAKLEQYEQIKAELEAL